MKILTKRLLPFFAAFALGLLVTSFFVAIALPDFRIRPAFRHSHKNHLKFENRKLRERIRNLEIELNQQKFQKGLEDLNYQVAPPVVK